jgi:hypothetical protein
MYPDKPSLNDAACPTPNPQERRIPAPSDLVVTREFIEREWLPIMQAAELERSELQEQLRQASNELERLAVARLEMELRASAVRDRLERALGALRTLVTESEQACVALSRAAERDPAMAGASQARDRLSRALGIARTTLAELEAAKAR